MIRRTIRTWILFYCLCALSMAALCASPQDDAGLIVRGGKELSWPRGSTPLFLLVDSSVEPFWSAKLDRGISIWNSVVGTEVIVSGGTADILSWDASSLGILVKPGQPGSDPTTEYIYNSSGQLSGAIIYLPPDVPEFLRLRVVVHELGHALGLAHDRNPRSVMFYVASTSEFEITVHDKALMKSLYGKRTN